MESHENKHLKYGSVEEWLEDENIPNGILNVDDKQLRDKYLKEYGELRQHLFDKHIKSLPKEDQELFEKGRHPSQSHEFKAKAKPYADALEKQLSSLGFVGNVSIGYYQMDRIVLSVDTNREISKEEHNMIPWLYKGFETKVGFPQPTPDVVEGKLISEKKSKLKAFFTIPERRLDKPPLEPKWAVIMSLTIIFVGLLAVAVASTLFYVSLPMAFFCYALVVYGTLGVSWSFLDWKSRNAAIRGNNYFVYFAIAIFIIAMITTDSYAPFPRWAIIALILGAIAGYSVMGFCGIRNFIRWKRGEFRKLSRLENQRFPEHFSGS